jgi:YVTN family beta-propeller protein
VRLWPGTVAATCVVALAAVPTASAAPLAYVTQGNSEAGGPHPHALAVFDVATGAKVRTIDLPHDAFDIAIAPNGRRAYLSTDGGLDVVDLATGSVVKTIPGLAGDVAVDPDGKRVFVTEESFDRIAVVDTATNTLGTPITVGDSPRAVVVDTQGKHAYAGNTGSPDSVSLVDLTTNLETGELSSGLDRPENLGISPAGNQLYIANFGGSAGGTTVSIFERPATQTPVTVGATPVAVTANPAGTTVYVASRDADSLSLIDPATRKRDGSIPMGAGFGPMSIAVTPDGRRAFVVASQDQKWAIVDLVTRKVVKGPVALVGSGEVAIPPVQPPVPAFTVRQSPGEVAFDASTSKGGPFAAFSWDFGDGDDAAGTKPTVTHRYAKAGRYTVKLFESNSCEEGAVFGPLGVAFGGHTAFCNGPRTVTKTKPVVVPKAAVAVVRSRKAKVSANGDAKVKLACVRELPCKGKIVVAWKPPGAKRFAKFDTQPFKKIPPAATGPGRFHLAPKPLAALHSKGKLSVRIVASTANAHHTFAKRSRKVKLSPR